MNNILVAFKIPNKFLTVCLKDNYNNDDSMIGVGISPKLRLRRRWLYIDNIDLAIKFENYLHQKLQKRDFKDRYELDLIHNCRLDKHQLRWQREDSEKIREVLKGHKLSNQIIEERKRAIANKVSDKNNFVDLIKSKIANERTAMATIQFYVSLSTIGYDRLKEHKSKAAFRKYTVILKDLGLEEKDMKALYRPTSSSKPNLRIL